MHIFFNNVRKRRREKNKLDKGVLLMTLWCKVAGFVPQHDANVALFKKKKKGMEKLD